MTYACTPRFPICCHTARLDFHAGGSYRSYFRMCSFYRCTRKQRLCWRHHQSSPSSTRLRSPDRALVPRHTLRGFISGSPDTSGGAERLHSGNRRGFCPASSSWYMDRGGCRISNQSDLLSPSLSPWGLCPRPQLEEFQSPSQIGTSRWLPGQVFCFLILRP